MLELRPTCENCDKALPPDSLEARICTYECTFLRNVCRYRLGERVPELRWRIRTQTNQTVAELERRQLPW